MADNSRRVLVTRERLDGWIERFGRRHGVPEIVRSGPVVSLTAPDGARAEYVDEPEPQDFGIVLARRGGYAVGLVRAGELIGHKCGTRYVQGKTKAGGWSQQRYARRRANQADDLSRACADAIDSVFVEGPVRVVFGGGDKPLVTSAVELSRRRPVLADRWLDVRDPRLVVLRSAVVQARSLRIALNELA